MNWFCRAPVTAVIFLAGVAAWSPIVFAQGPAATMQVGVTVAPKCGIAVDEATTAPDSSPSVRVTCGRRALRALRVSAGPAAAQRPLEGLELGGLRAGAEVAFVVPHALATVASREPFIASPAARPPLVITFDF